MGALVTLDLPDDSPLLTLPWIITFGPLSDEEEWDAVVCGPYERAHALALAEAVLIEEEDVTAVVEPVVPHATVAEIRSDIDTAKASAAEELDEEDGEDDMDVSVDASYDEEAGYADDDDEDEEDYEFIEAGPLPPPEEIRAGFARIAARLTAGV